MNACSITKACVTSLLLTAVIQPGYAHENPDSDATNNAISTIYKTVDIHGKVSYSQVMPQNSIFLEEISIAPLPRDQNIEHNRARLDSIRETTETLAEARQQREAKREQQENKRLQRLALIRAASQPPYERKVYVSYPLWRSFPHHHKHHLAHRPKHRPGVPAGKSGLNPQLPFLRGLSPG